MAEAPRLPTSPLHRGGEASHKATLPLREPSKEDLEGAEQLIGHAQGLRENINRSHNVRNDQSDKKLTISENSMAASSSTYPRTPTPTEDTTVIEQQDTPYSKPAPVGVDVAPTGQVCRYCAFVERV